MLTAVPSDRESVAPYPLVFREVYRDNLWLVWRTLARFGVREADLMDVAQNVFLVVHRQLATFEGRADVSTWLVSICRFVARDYLRSAPIRREVVVDSGDLAGLESDREPLDVEARDSSHLLAAILQRIPEKLRKVVVLFELEQMSGDEIARLLQVPVGTVRSRLRLARAALRREALAEMGVLH